MVDTSNLKTLAVSDTGFVFDPRSGATFTLNPTGLAVLLSLRGGVSLEGIVEALGHSFDASGAGVREDVLDFVQTLRLHGLLGPVTGASREEVTR